MKISARENYEEVPDGSSVVPKRISGRLALVDTADERNRRIARHGTYKSE